MQGDVEERLLQSIVDATASLFDAEASSIALFETDPDRLEFRVAAGVHGAGAVGLHVKPTEGIAGFVFSTGQALALTDVASDPRFDREAAGAPGVLCLGLDKRGSPSFSLRDMELLAVFSKQATTAITATRVQRDTGRLMAEVLRQLADGTMTDAQVEALVSDVTRDIDDHPDAPFWRLVDHVALLRGLGERDLTLVGDILEVVARHAKGARRRA